MEIGEFLKSVLMSPAVILPLAVFAALTLFRKLCSIWWPHFERSRVYKTILSILPYTLGPGFAFAIKGFGFMAELTWGYVALVGMVSGFLNDIIWRAFKGVLKRVLKLTDDDINKAIERKSTLPPDQQ